MGATDNLSTTETKLKRIAWLSKSDPEKEYWCLMHHFNEASLKHCFNELDGRKAVGIDGIDKDKYAQDLDANLEVLVTKMKRMAYRPEPVRQVDIPKEGKRNEKRPLGISNFEDKVVQKMMQKVLESIYEPLFLNCSYGFRPGRGCIDAIRALQHQLYQNRVRIVIDVDLSNYFGTIDHKLLSDILAEKLKDKRFMRYIRRMFKAGVLADGELSIIDEGVAQGSTASPILANIYAHYVIDKWFEDVVKPHCKGQVELFRYCDDAVICCEEERDAIRIREALSRRLAKYKLKLNEEKTKMIRFCKWARKRGEKQGAFDFLGFTFYWGKTKDGAWWVPKVKTSGKRISTKLKKVRDWVKAIKDKCRLKEIWRIFCVKLRGHIQYYGVSHNQKRVSSFIYQATRILYKWLNRRSQRKSFTWDKFWQFVKANPLPQAKTCHKLF